MANKTKDGLPIVEEKTLFDFLKEYDLTLADNDSTVTSRIKSENPQIYRMLRIGMKNAPNKEARAYYELGMQIMYELLRGQSIADNKEIDTFKY